MGSKTHSFFFMLLLLLIFLGIVSIVALKPALTKSGKTGILKWDSQIHLPQEGPNTPQNYGTEFSR